MKKKIRNRVIAIEKRKCKINFNKSIYIGTGILDLRKVLVKDFDYNYIEHKYGGN